MNAGSRDKASEESIGYARVTVDNLLSGNLDYNKLVLSKQLKARYTIRKDNISP